MKNVGVRQRVLVGAALVWVGAAVLFAQSKPPQPGPVEAPAVSKTQPPAVSKAEPPAVSTDGRCSRTSGVPSLAQQVLCRLSQQS
jgi:hypothetical protein